MGDLAATKYLPVAYLPGASGRCVSWEPIASVLAYRREPLLFDYPGLGDIDEVPGIGGLSDLSAWLGRQLPELCDVVTLSTGSALGLRLALDYPARVRRLVLVTPCGSLGVERFGAVDWRDTFVRQRPQAPRWFVNDRTDFSDRLSTIGCPTLLVFGDQDRIAPAALGPYMQERLPVSKLEVITDAGHDLEEEHPAFVASLIEAHLRR